MEERVKGKPSNPNPPIFMGGMFKHFNVTQIRPAKKIYLRTIFEQKLPEREGIQKPPPMLATSRSNYGRGFHLFNLFTYFRILDIFDQQMAHIHVE